MPRHLPARRVAALAAAIIVTSLIAAACGRASSLGSDGAVTPSEPPASDVHVVLVHGAWADTSSWDAEVAALRERGYDARAIANPVENLITDAQSVARFLSSLEGPIVLVGHSYGGSVITNAAAGNPNVEALVYVDAAAPDVGETNGSLSGDDSVLKLKSDDELFDTLTPPGADAGVADLYLKQEIFVEHFGRDLPEAQAMQLWATQRSASTAAFDTPSEQAAWKTIPSWYFISTGDDIITQTSQEAMARRANSTVTIFEGGSHLTLISQPDAVTAVILDAIESVR